MVDWKTHLPYLEGLKDGGKIDLIGVTYTYPPGFPEMMDIMKTGRIQTIQISYNALEREAEEEMLPLAEELGNYLRLGFYRRHVEKQGLDPDDLQGTAAHLGIAGTADECRAQLDSYRSSGLDELVVRPVPVGKEGLGASGTLTHGSPECGSGDSSDFAVGVERSYCE